MTQLQDDVVGFLESGELNLHFGSTPGVMSQSDAAV
eukprot:CAMPEP_0178441988 /NCGR_PEP_ID=MMETSP0689_2-20121128/37874_1 /TAXON_ID=160604 /ORGANISM="Amphidinium massartii, Strain CS-259" /LENGTH=35 /DNA_ID= /DNA_START= /DNA_END= /DNA_ORIENTATION=